MMEERNIAEEIDCYIAKKRYRLINSVILWQEGEILAENYYALCYEKHFIGSNRDCVQTGEAYRFGYADSDISGSVS